MSFSIPEMTLIYLIPTIVMSDVFDNDDEAYMFFAILMLMISSMHMHTVHLDIFVYLH
jgi:hypothetical protein